MNAKRLALCLFAASTLQLNAQYLEHLYDYIENTSVFEEGQEEGHAYYLADDHLSLNGPWRFYFANTPEEVPRQFFDTRFKDSKWRTIRVPINWEMEGYGDAQFRNVPAPFKANPPFVPKDYNPTGAYRKTFTLPAQWKGQQVFLRLEKAQSASFVWMNGQQVGYNEGGQEPAEYDVTPYVKPGKNVLAVCVLKYSDGYYLEGQDYWRLAGIFDDVTLYATPTTRLFDWYVTTDLDEQYRDATLRVAVDVKKYDTASAVYAVRATLTDAKGNQVKQMTTEPFTIISQGEKKSVELTSRIANPDKWTSETPVLYGLKLELLNDAGTVMQTITTKMGFKETEIRHQTFYLNGQPIKVNAINSHMQHPELGHAMDEATIRKDMEILKQHNFNAVRTSHYPPVNKYLELADEYGLYIIDEAGTEAHATEYISNDQRFREMYLERVQKLVLRDRNHPCVLFWSAGNESGEGPLITEVVKEGKRLDPTRYFMYGGNAYAHPGEEIIGPRYPTPYELEMNTAMVPEEQDPRPSFMDEYLSVAGNAGGGLDEYWAVIRRHPRLMGGAIWDFVNPGLTEHIRPLKDSSPYATPAHLMGNAKVAKGVLHLSGHDEWVEVYRSNNVELASKELTISFDVKPGKLSGTYEGAPYVTKGNTQFGVVQRGSEKLQFYLHSGVKHTLDVSLPADWVGNWHHVTASWDGKEMSLYIDGQLKGTEKTAAPEQSGQRRGPRGGGGGERGILSNFPYPVNIGRIAGNHAIDPMTTYTADAEMDNVAIYNRCLADGEGRAEDAVLYLTFDGNGDEGTFYTIGGNMRTYGCIWPDRTVQPEMKQMKWTTQPVSIRLLNAATGEAEVTNRLFFTDLSQYATHWTLMADGDVLEEGDMQLTTAPQQSQVVRIPYHKPTIVPGKEYRVTITSTLKKDEVWAKAGHEVAWDQLELTSWNIPATSPLTSHLSPLTTQEDDTHITISGDGFRYVISKLTGDLEQMEVAGKQVLKSPITFNLWRAPLANEFDSWDAFRVNGGYAEGYGNQVATLWYSKGVQQLRVVPAQVRLTSKNTVSVSQLVQVGASSYGQLDLYISGVQLAGFSLDYTYQFYDDGTVKIHNHLSPQGRLPEMLPRIGFTTQVANDFDHITWYGRGPEENYPDRKTGYQVGVWSKTVAEMYEPYLMPQDYGLRTDNRYVQLRDGDGHGVQIGMNEHFNFNAYPFTTDNLTKSQFTYQLQPQKDCYTLNIDYATTGVGCTCVYVLDEYRVKPEAYDRVVTIKPLK
jgi:beta-galactosidase